MRRSLAFLPLLLLGVASPLHARSKPPPELLYYTEGNNLHRLDVDTIGDKDGPRDEILIRHAGAESGGGGDLLFVSPNRDINGMVCRFPDGSGRFVASEDTRQPSPPPGFGVFEANGLQIGKLTPTYFSSFGEPYGCAFAADADPGDGELPPLFTTDVGTEDIGGADGQLILWFPPYDAFPGPPGAYPETDEVSGNFCKIASDIGTAGGVAIDGLGRVYVASASESQILRFSPPFPTGPDAAGGCGGTDALGSPVADSVSREVFASQDPAHGMFFFTGLAIGPNGHLFAASVVNGAIGEYDLDGSFQRQVLAPAPGPISLPTPFGNPQGIAVGADGTVYYADLDLVGTFPSSVDTGDDGKIRRIRFDKKGNPLTPEILRDGLGFPDAVTVLPGDLERKKAGGRGKTEWRAYAGGPERLFFQPKEKKLKPGKLGQLRERWRYQTAAIVTDSPVVARVDVPGEGAIQVVYFSSWDNNIYAVRLSDGSALWHFTADLQPGSTYPAAGSGLVERVGERDVLFMPLGEVLYALDAVTGEEIWRFTAGTGCADALGEPPGLCAFDGERNQVETSPIAADGKVFFGMDVNDVETGKGGFYAVDAADGRLAWYFDLETGSTCVPDAGDAIRAFDGYHDEADLGLPAGFLASRSGCDFDRAPTGCGNVWSSPSLDAGRALLYFASSNCDTGGPGQPPPPMPPYDEALVALHLDGTPAWRWRPREVDDLDLAFGATPNLFSIRRGKKRVDVVGIGGKDGSYYVVDRDGVNEDTGAAFDPMDPLALPYWHTKVVKGGGIGGIIGTPAVDQKKGRIYMATGIAQGAPGEPTVHALDLDSGAILWQFQDAFANYAPASATPKLLFAGSLYAAQLRVFDPRTGELLMDPPLNLFPERGPFGAVSSGPVVVDGTLLVGTGIGAFGSGDDTGNATALLDSALVALCVPSSKGCPKD
jgi:outer membrane protein assembly factor BamB